MSAADENQQSQELQELDHMQLMLTEHFKQMKAQSPRIYSYQNTTLAKPIHEMMIAHAALTDEQKTEIVALSIASVHQAMQDYANKLQEFSDKAQSAPALALLENYKLILSSTSSLLNTRCCSNLAPNQ